MKWHWDSPINGPKNTWAWWFKVTFLGWLSDPFKGLSDLQRLGIKRSRLESPGDHIFPTFQLCQGSRSRFARDCFATSGSTDEAVFDERAVEDDAMDFPWYVPFPQTKPGFFTPASTWQYYNNGPCGCKMFFLLKMRDISGKAMLEGKKSLNQILPNFQPRKPWGFFVVCFFVWNSQKLPDWGLIIVAFWYRTLELFGWTLEPRFFLMRHSNRVSNITARTWN